MRFDHGARRARGSLGLQRDGAVALVGKGVHFLLNDVRRVAHAALKQLRMLEHGRTDFAVSGQMTYAAHRLFDFVPAMTVFRKHILRSLGRLCKHVIRSSSKIEIKPFTPRRGERPFRVATLIERILRPSQSRYRRDAPRFSAEARGASFAAFRRGRFHHARPLFSRENGYSSRSRPISSYSAIISALPVFVKSVSEKSCLPPNDGRHMLL